MAGDGALKLLIDIQARDSARGVLASLLGFFPLLIGSFRMLGTAASEFASGRILTGFMALGSALKGIAVAALQLAGLLAIVATAIAIALGIKAVKAAADFQQGLNRLVTGAGDVTDNMQKMGQAILGVSIHTGVLTDKLLPAMYLILSAGQRGAQAIDTLTVATKGAVIEQAKAADVANVLSGVMTNYGTKTFNATQFMNGLIRAVQLGKITLQQLAVAMGPIDPIARSLGISFNDVAAAMTTQTNAMVPAARAATGLRFMMLALENPTKKATDAMAAMGLKSADVANEMKVSLPGALQMIYDAAKRAGPEGSVPFDRAIADMVGGIRSFTAFTALTGPHMKDFIKNSQDILAVMKANKDAVLGWDTASQGFNVQMGMVNAAIQALFISIGTQLLPKLTALAGVLVPLITNFATWVTNAQPLSGFLDQIASAIATVWPAARKANDAIAPLTDTFDRAKGVIKQVSDALHPVADALFKAQTNAKPLLDTFDRATSVFKNVQQAANPLVPIFLWLRDAFIKTRDSAIAVYNFLVPIGTFIGSTLSPLVKALGLVITTVLVPAWKLFVTQIQPYLPALLALAEVIGVILVAAFILVAGIILGVIIAIGLVIAAFLAIVAAVLWVNTQVSNFVHMLVTNVVGFFKWLWQQLVGGSIVPDIVNGIIAWFLKLLAQSQTIFGNLRTALVAIVLSLGTQIIASIQATLARWAVQLLQWAGLSRTQAQAVVTAIMSAINTLPGLLASAGLHMMQSLASGIAAGAGAAVAAALSVASSIAAVLHHSKPDVGPLRDDDVWGLHFAMNIADGIRHGAPAVAMASMLLATAMGGENYSGLSSSPDTFVSARYSTGSSPVIVIVQPPSITLDGAEVTNKIMRRAGDDIRRHGGPFRNG